MRSARLAVALAATVAACGGVAQRGNDVATTASAAVGTSTTTVDPVSGVGGAPVTPRSARETTVFEGIPVVGVLPPGARGLVFVFHGSGGSEKFVDKIETVDVLNQLEDAGFAWVATASVDRDGDRAWELSSADPAENRDLARMLRLHRFLVATGRVGADLPVHGLGMSNGARFTGLWADVMRKKGLNVASAVMVMGTVDPHVDQVVVPTLFVAAVNDDRVSPARITAQYEDALADGAEVRLIVLRQRPVSSSRFTRIPGIDPRLAEEVFSDLSSVRLIGATGELLMSPDRLRTVLDDLDAPLTVVQRRDLADQIAADLALHQFNAAVGPDIVEWFAAD